MAKHKVEITYKCTGVVDFGELPEPFIKALVQALCDGSMGDTTYSEHDFCVDEWETVDVQVTKKAGK